eukprot:scaffold76623_cov69-Phaeocystis_antarctica.AAC.6
MRLQPLAPTVAGARARGWRAVRRDEPGQGGLRGQAGRAAGAGGPGEAAWRGQGYGGAPGNCVERPAAACRLGGGQFWQALAACPAPHIC